MSEATHTPGPWSTGRRPDSHCRIYAPSKAHAIARTYGPELNGIGVCALTGPKNEADALLIAAAPELLEALKKRTENAEQSAFEHWLLAASPSGDAEQVQAQWEKSSDFHDFCDEWECELAAIDKATGAA